ncbi:hypothetical protein IV203_023520 [Nitzschia inconspicua]|uniref:Uncharacterized protein n=1 Tax=Nitzschia inconspicua TaxID=303405 RepID=A0A9K3KD81_9STRA|nr:hypothetical protein IV203_023520 [Nitzschia inconspicua]
MHCGKSDEDGPYAVLEIDRKKRRVFVCDGIPLSLQNWYCHILIVMQRTKLVPLDASIWFEEKSKLYLCVDGVQEWSVESTKLLPQKDGYNCGPVACLKVWKTFLPEDIALALLRPGKYRPTVVKKFHELIEKCSKHINWVPKAQRKAIPTNVKWALDESTTGDGDPKAAALLKKNEERKAGPVEVKCTSDGSRKKDADQQTSDSEEVSEFDVVTSDNQTCGVDT